MIHLIYIYIAINAFFVGLGFKDLKEDYKPIFSTLLIIGGFLFALPYIIIYFGFYFIKLVFQSTWLANYITVFQVLYCNKKITASHIEILNNGIELKFKKLKLTCNDKIYIWGAFKIIKHYNKNLKSNNK